MHIISFCTGVHIASHPITAISWVSIPFVSKQLAMHLWIFVMFRFHELHAPENQLLVFEQVHIIFWNSLKIWFAISFYLSRQMFEPAEGQNETLYAIWSSCAIYEQLSREIREPSVMSVNSPTVHDAGFNVCAKLWTSRGAWLSY